MKKKNILKRRITKEKKEKRDNLDGNKKQLKKRTAKEKKGKRNNLDDDEEEQFRKI